MKKDTIDPWIEVPIDELRAEVLKGLEQLKRGQSSPGEEVFARLEERHHRLYGHPKGNKD